jgi:predicted O-linked N-acetylglucosamine transferase (SPINDLY family)
MSRPNIEQTFQIAIRHHQAGRLEQAQSIYSQILAQQPEHADALHLMGLIAHQTGRPQAALGLIRRAIALRPDDAEMQSNLGSALRAAGHSRQAIDACRAAIALNPNFADAHCNLGIALIDQRQLDAAIAAFRQAIALKSDLAEAHNNLGNALRSKGELDEAIAALRQAIALRSQYADAYRNLGLALTDSGELDEAIGAYRRAIALRPNFHQAHSSLICVMNYHPGYDAQTILGECRQWNQQYAQPLGRFFRPHGNDRNPDRRLRIGYVSPDFREHPVGRFLLPVLANHDKSNFEIFAYAQVAAPDAITQRLQSHVDGWRSIIRSSDAQAADLVRHDQVDILVDLALHTARNRLLVFAHRPAPIQVTFAGYPGTTGLQTIDYRLTDPYLDPPGDNDSFYSEKSIRLPDCFWCYDPGPSDLVVNELPALAGNGVTFGCLNNFAKLNQSVLAVWSAILRACPNSRMVILAGPGEHRRRTAASLGVDPTRVEFVDSSPREQYLKQYHRLDLVLDTFPYNGHTTTCDALWMGVPVVSLADRPAVGRGGLSILSNIGLAELVVDSKAKYVQIASELAGNLDRLANLRSTLRQRMAASPLMDAPRFARYLEDAYRRMWRDWTAG